MGFSCKAIIFDCVGPILIKKPEILDSLSSEINELRGEVKDENAFWEDIKQKYSLSQVEIEKIILKISDHFEKNLPMWEFLEKAKRNYKIAMINNGTKTIFEIWTKKYDFPKHFEVLVNSTIFGVKKPDPRIYLHTCKSLGVKPKACVFVDDDLVNVEGARRVGMKGILYDPRKHEEFLKEIGD